MAGIRFRVRHTDDNILQQYEDNMARYQISHKVSHTVTDSASNMLKAFSLNLPRFDSSLDDEQDYNDQDNLKTFWMESIVSRELTQEARTNS